MRLNRGDVMELDRGREFIHGLTESNELAHYGVPGMKWGVRKAVYGSIYKSAKNSKIEEKANKYDLKAVKAYKKGEKLHAKNDLGRANKAAKKAGKYAIKSAKYEKKANRSSNELVKSMYEKKAAKKQWQSDRSNREAQRLSRTTGYGLKAARVMAKGDKYASKASKARYKIANNNHYIAKMQTKYSDIPAAELRVKREILRQFLDL